MKNRSLFKFFAVLLSFAVCLSAFGGSLAVWADPQPEVDDTQPEHTVCSVTDFGADGSDEADDFYAFRTAIGQALYTDGILEVTIPAGTYYVSGNTPVYSNTVITADPDATIISTCPDKAQILFGVHLADGSDYLRCDHSGNTCTHGGHSQTQNVTISGGTWDRGAANSATNTGVFSFRHAHNITIKDLTVQNATDHMINLSGTDSVLIENVTVKNQVPYTNTDSAFWGHYTPGDKNRYNTLEAIHLDFCNKEGENSDFAKPFDNTPAENITIKNCTFENVYVCVGNHHPAVDGRPGNITVTGCKMTDIRSYCVYADCFDNLIVSDNKIVRAPGIARLNNTRATVNGNTFTASTADLAYNGIYAVSGAALTAVGNTITGSGENGISGDKNSTVTANGNIIKNAAKSGLSAKDSSTLKADKNEITGCGHHAIIASGKSKAELSGSTVSGIGKSALRATDNSTLKVQNNTVNSFGERAIYCDKSSSLTATGNTIGSTPSGQPAIKVDSSPATINGNTIKSSSHDGIVVYKSNNSTVKDNAVSNTAAVGIHIYYSTGCTVSGNTVTGTKKHGILVEGDSSLPASATLSKNTVSGAGGSGIRLGKYAKGCALQQNTLKGCAFSADSTATYVNYVATPKLTGISNAKTGITLKWGKVSGAVKYRVFRKNGSAGYKKLADVSGSTVSYTDKSAKSGTKYTYTVRAVSKDGKIYASGYDKTGKTLTRLSQPALKKITPAKGKITVTWGKVTGAKGYYVYRKVGTGKWTKYATLTGTTYTDKKVSKGKKYTYTVYAYNGTYKSTADSKGLSAKAK